MHIFRFIKKKYSILNNINLHSNILFFSINEFNSSIDHVIVFVVFYYRHRFHSGRNRLMMAVNAMGGSRKQKSGKLSLFMVRIRKTHVRNVFLIQIPGTDVYSLMIGRLSSLPFWSTDDVPQIRRRFQFCSLKKYFAGPQQVPAINQRSKRLPYAIINRSDVLMKDLKRIITSFRSIVVDRSNQTTIFCIVHS